MMKTNSDDQSNIAHACDQCREEKRKSRETLKQFNEKIYDSCKKYVYQVLGENFKFIMYNIQMKDDLVQDVWEMIFSVVKKYDPQKGALTTFVDIWIRHAALKFYYKNFSKISSYYAEALRKIEEATNRCRREGISPDISALRRYSGFSAKTIKNALKIAQIKDTLSFENLEKEEYTERVKSPEEIVMLEESAKTLDSILEETLTDFEKSVLNLRLNPRDPEKKYSSYREIAEQLGTNISKIKRTKSRIAKKLKENETFKTNYSYI